MENVKVVLKNANGESQQAVPINFRFIRERYTPYTQCTGVFIGNIEISSICTIELYYNGTLLHRGMSDSIVKKYKDGRFIISFLSRGYTLLLGQNEPKPGIRNNLTLGGLISENAHIPNVQWEATTDLVNYIYVKEKSTIWDAICAYSYKAYKNYPYIKNTNTVYASVVQSPKTFNYNSERIITMGESVSTSGLLSKLYMCDTEGEYTYTQDNSIADDYNIVRRKYYPLDKQWLENPEDGLKAKLNYSNRGKNAVYLVYAGHKFENLMDKGNYNLDGINFMLSEHISGVEVTGNKNGVFTKITVYRDSYQ